MSGSDRGVHILRHTACPECGYSGRKNITHIEKSSTGGDILVFDGSRRCDLCGGSGEIKRSDCPICNPLAHAFSAR